MAAKCDSVHRHTLPGPAGSRTPLDLWQYSLRSGINEPEVRLYSYVVRTIHLEHGLFVQHGSAPNFQGGYVTLCTCKHEMRSFLDCERWKGVWIAGLSSRSIDAYNVHYLVYLMRVKWAFPSHCDLWHCPELPLHMKEAKAAHLHPLGDLYWPMAGHADPYNPASYRRPVREHSHEKDEKWHKDINYLGDKTLNRPALLVGDPEQTYVWHRPVIYTCRKFTQGQRKWCLGNFLPGFDIRTTADEDRTA